MRHMRVKLVMLKKLLMYICNATFYQAYALLIQSKSAWSAVGPTVHMGRWGKYGISITFVPGIAAKWNATTRDNGFGLLVEVLYV